MSKVKIKTTKQNRAGRTVNVRPDVSLEFNSNLEAEIDEKDLKKVIDIDPSLYMDDDDAQGKGEDKMKDGADKSNKGADDADSDGDSETDKTQESGEKTEKAEKPAEKAKKDEETGEGDELDLSKESLMKKNKDEIQDILEGAGVPKEQWADLNKEPLVDFLIKQLS